MTDQTGRPRHVVRLSEARDALPFEIAPEAETRAARRASVFEALRKEEGIEFTSVVAPAEDDRLAIAARRRA